MGHILLGLRFAVYLPKLNESTRQFEKELDGIVTLIGSVYVVQSLYSGSRITCTLTK